MRTPLVRLGGSEITPLGTIDLPVLIGAHTDLNKACPQDPYQLPQINLFVDSTAGCGLFNMMDVYQILGIHVSERGVKANLEKIEAIMQLKSPKMLKDVQKLTGSWLLHVDGSSNANNGGAGVLIQGPDGIELEVAARLSFATTNNKAEYETLVLGLELAEQAGAKELNVYIDSQLVAMQIEGSYETRE
ncbi:UNVERIFIED_CONTAM: hypothetical protein Sradi_5880500 [Sesamum radiatum]|uniref:RNase H type-1 domain-containing protein n=1 Tax=Sesamum radiatum TaxID=300843 RepID=A0AAW2KU25_SESRA